MLAISAQTQGQGHETTFAQLVAHELGLSPDDVDVGGTMIVRVNYHSQSAQPQDCRHCTMVP